MDQTNCNSRPKAHPKDPAHKRKKQKQLSWKAAENHVVQATSAEYDLGRLLPLTTQIQSFLDQVLLKQDTRDTIISMVLQDLGPCLVNEFGQCTPYIFGSMANGLCLRGSDMDIYLDIAMYQNTLSEDKHGLQTIVERCAAAMRCNRRFNRIVAIAHARVPIVKFVHKYTNMSGDISFKNPLGVCNTRLLNYYLSLHQRIFEVTMIVKYWAKQHSICTFEYISSYGWTLLLISYLQSLRLPDSSPLLPSVHELQNGWPSDPRAKVNGWRVDFHPRTNRLVLPNSHNFSTIGLLEGFFTYYSEFPFEDNIVCPFLGEPIPWSGLTGDGTSTFPSKFMWYQQHFKRFFMDKIEKHPKVSIQDPFQHDFLLGGACNGKKFDKVRAYLQMAVTLCRTEKELKDPTKSTFLTDLFTYELEAPAEKFELKLKAPLGMQREVFIDLAVHTLEDTFREIMKFEVSSQSNASLSNGEMSSKVSKTGDAQNVHQCDDGEDFERVFICFTSHPTWNFRKKLRKHIKFAFPETAFDFEKKLSNEIVSRKYCAENCEFLCTVTVPKKDLTMRISFEERTKQKTSNVNITIFLFLRNNLPVWLNNFIMEKSVASAGVSDAKKKETVQAAKKNSTDGGMEEEKCDTPTDLESTEKISSDGDMEAEKCDTPTDLQSTEKISTDGDMEAEKCDTPTDLQSIEKISTDGDSIEEKFDTPSDLTRSILIL